MISSIFNEFVKKIVEIKKKEGFESVKFFDFTVEEKWGAKPLNFLQR